MRGQAFHNYLVYEAAAVIEDAGFVVEYEAPVELPNGQRDFFDILGWCDGKAFGCEIETTPRNALSNVQKALELGLPLFIVVPNKNVLRAVRRKLEAELGELPEKGISLSLLGQLQQALTNRFSTLSVGESWKGKRKDKSLSSARAGGA